MAMFIDPGAFESIGESMKAFASDAASGSFGISETGGHALLRAIRNMKDWVDANRDALWRWGEEPPLGTSEGATTMKPFIVRVATDDKGFVPMLMKFRESLTDAEQGINDAIRNYQAVDQRGASRQQPV
jgi:hypothetical protein